MLDTLPGLTVEIVEGPEAGRQIALTDSLVVGRTEDAGLMLRDTKVSRRHARITPDNGSATVEDLGSTNGTFINAAQLFGPARLSQGDELLIGVTIIELRTAAAVAQQASAVRAVPPALVAPPRPPAYVSAGPESPPGALDDKLATPELDRLVDVRTKRLARTAPLAVLVLVALVLIAYFATR
jgi:pSer/pThr/pTyr-binding forkhead associated (FHA) protein